MKKVETTFFQMKKIKNALFKLKKLEIFFQNKISSAKYKN